MAAGNAPPPRRDGWEGAAFMMAGLLAQATSLPSISPEGGGTLWLPPEAASGAAYSDDVFYFIYWVSLFFFVLIVALMVWFVIRYRQRVPGQPAAGGITHSTRLEITWTIIPVILVIIMFYMGFRGYMDLVNPPTDAIDIQVLGQKWSWNFTYPNGHDDGELHVPVDRNIRLTLTSNDVVHSFYIPAFRIKRDAMPGRYNHMWFRPTKTGEYLALCSEYCGTGHSDMQARVVVEDPADYQKWLMEVSDPFREHSFADVGRMLVMRKCSSCHSVDGRAGVGPTFKGVFGHEVKLQDGSTVTADENYIRESILYPSRQVVAGFSPVMPTFRGQLKDREITAIIEYLKGLAE
jgi:cytochrome c oxidase subunit 2